ncbi:hypothetical protein X798_02999 [Onchocerca flexuosa]|uniref:IPT/TIG domain-containing protein n=1 Tax=Onchocerca flexuosa TaxID=387005 RepID=A0A238BXA5_9BILA|nr:hypothetical protein X798_02999 [Onchocerca flexuosa]
MDNNGNLYVAATSPMIHCMGSTMRSLVDCSKLASLLLVFPSRESLPLVSTREPPNYDITGAGSLEGEAAVHVRAEHELFELSTVLVFDCVLCMSSSWSCQWCEMENICLSLHEKCQISLKLDNTTSICPQIDPIVRNKMIMAVNSDQMITLQMLHINDQEQSHFAYRFHYRGITVVRNASLKKSMLSCDSWNYTLNRNVSQISLQMEVLRNGILIDKSSVTIKLQPYGFRLFNMSFIGSKLEMCMVRWYLPVEGGTRIEIRGRDLGSSLGAIKGRVFVTGSKCKVIEFEITSRNLCEVSAGIGSGSVPLRLKQTGRRFANPTMLYKFVDPQSLSFYPSFGPLSGSTKLTIYGSNLDTGSNTSILIGIYPCEVLLSSSLLSSITCLTNQSDKIGIYRIIQVTIDRSIRIFHGRFEYRSDPIIEEIHPKEIFQNSGRVIERENLNSVLNAKMFIKYTNSEGAISELSDCHMHNTTLMRCLSPRVFLSSSILLSTSIPWPVAFLMDGVQPVRDFGGRIQLFSSAHQNSCTTRSEQLFCRAPQTEPEAMDEKDNVVDGGRPLVVVILGTMLYELGFVEYEAFAELQTGVTDLKITNDNQSIPFHNKTESYIQILFRNITLHNNSLHGQQFLNRNIQFLLKLVEMVDSALSSLVVGSSLDDMRYCTEVVFAILNHHILLSLKKCEPHIIFRQSGSLADLCFMEYLKDGPGQSMYLLYKALKYQIERGPVDAITGDAQYSLNDSRLLRRPFNVTSMIMLMTVEISCFSFYQSVFEVELPQTNLLATSTHSIQYYHLEQPLSTENCIGKKDDAANTSIPEIFLTRLLIRIVQKFVDGFVESITYTNGKECPSLLLFVFHIFDGIDTRNNFTDETAVRSWKVNIWILRFWVNILSNIDYVLDVERIPAVDGSLAVIAQTLVDAFSNANYKFEKESPSSKLLFAKDIKRYRTQVANFFPKCCLMRFAGVQSIFVNISGIRFVYTHVIQEGPFVSAGNKNSFVHLLSKARLEIPNI